MLWIAATIRDWKEPISYALGLHTATYTWDNQPHKKTTDDQVHVVVLEASVLEIDIDELRVAASRLADVEFRHFIVLANCECFPTDTCSLTGSMLCMKYASKSPCWC